MTISRSQHEHSADDERCVDELLAESGFPEDTQLRDMLLQLRSLRCGTVPPPSAELAALLESSMSGKVAPIGSGRRTKRRFAFTSLAVAASLGVAGGAAAGNEGLRTRAAETLTGIVALFTPPAPAQPAPEAPSMAPGAAPRAPDAPVAVVASPAGPPVPVAPSPAPLPARAPAPGEADPAPQSFHIPSSGRNQPAGPRPAAPPAVSQGNPAEAPASRPAGQPPAAETGNAAGSKGKDKAAPGPRDVTGAPGPVPATAPGPPQRGR